MAKQDVLDAINATIAPNNIKGITAESLNNVLTMMAENAGEGGSGDGALRVIVPDMLMLGPEVVAMGELSPTSWEEMKLFLEQSGLDPSEYDAVVKASFEHNANVAQQIIEKAKAGQGVSVVLDQTPYCPAAFSILSQEMPEYAVLYEDSAACVVQPAALYMEYVKPTPEGEDATGMVGEQLACMLNPPASSAPVEWSALYPSNMQILLNLDGSLLFEVIEEEQPSSGSGVVTFDVSLSGVSSGEMKSNNKASYESWIANKETSVIIRIEDGGEYTYAYPISTMFSDNLLKVYYIPPTITDGKVSIKGVSVQADGLATHYTM